MKKLSEALNQAMKSKGYSIRSLEAATVERYGRDKQISRSLISDYKVGKRAPTYEGAIILAEILELDKKEFLLQTYFARQKVKQEMEKERFTEFCKKIGIGVTPSDLNKH